jgi:hypothetical protein
MYNCHAQQHGAQWVLGPLSSVLDFREDTIARRTLPGYIPLRLTSACISDENGDLLYVCHGSSITDLNGDTLMNGDGLSPCLYTDQNQDGFAIQQAAIFLPWPGNSNLYALLHFSNDAQSNSRPARLYYSIIDKNRNFGLGEVIQKNTVFHDYVTIRGGGMTACKHANGRDWWITVAKRLSNRYYTFLLSPEGITDTLTQDVGPVYSDGFLDNSYSCFSEDGTIYATGAYSGYITVLDFDRCSGSFSNPRIIFNNISGDPDTSVTGVVSIAFSPNGRFLYTSARLDINQYDLQGNNIQDSSRIYTFDPLEYNQIKMLELGPNGKLYGCTWNGGNPLLHVINRPDEKGDSAEFVYGGQPTLTVNSSKLPNMPNYRLGALAGSGCDTIITGINDIHTLNDIRIQPNPSDKYLYAEMPRQGNYTFELLNEAGQIVSSKHTKQVDIFDTEELPNGVYFLQVKDNSKVVTNKQVVVRH